MTIETPPKPTDSAGAVLQLKDLVVQYDANRSQQLKLTQRRDDLKESLMKLKEELEAIQGERGGD